MTDADWNAGTAENDHRLNDAGDDNGSTADGNHDPENYASSIDAAGPYPPTYSFFQFSTFLYSGRKSIRYRFKFFRFQEKTHFCYLRAFHLSSTNSISNLLVLLVGWPRKERSEL